MEENTTKNSNLAITSVAASKLLALRDKYDQHLKFHLFVDDSQALSVRIHDKLYDGDWVLEMNGVGVSFSLIIISKFKNLLLDCVAKRDSECGYEFLLKMSGIVVSRLDGDDAIRRIESEEVEVCDAYREFCYQTYT